MLKRVTDIKEIIDYEGLYILNIDDETVKIGKSTNLKSRLSSYLTKSNVAYVPCDISNIRESVALRYLKNILNVKPKNGNEYFSHIYRSTLEKLISFFSRFSAIFITELNNTKYEKLYDTSIFSNYIIPCVEDDIDYIDDADILNPGEFLCNFCQETFDVESDIDKHLKLSIKCMSIRLRKAEKTIQEKDKLIEELKSKIMIENNNIKNTVDDIPQLSKYTNFDNMFINGILKESSRRNEY
jgi:hypothetical protein